MLNGYQAVGKETNPAPWTPITLLIDPFEVFLFCVVFWPINSEVVPVYDRKPHRLWRISSSHSLSHCGRPSPPFHWIGGWVGLSAGLVISGKRKIFWFCGGIELRFLGRPDRSVVTTSTSLSQLPLLRRMEHKCYPLHLASRLVQLYYILDLLAIFCRK